MDKEILISKPWVKLHQLGGQNLRDSIIDILDEAFVQAEGHCVVQQQGDAAVLRPRQTLQDANVSGHS